MAPHQLQQQLLDARALQSDALEQNHEEEHHVKSSREQELAGVLKMEAEALRGVSLPSLLSSCAVLFADNGQAARDDPSGTFAKSRTVHALSFFVSHSWRTSRLFKWAALCVHFNLRRAALASLAVNFFVFILNLFCLESLPSWLVLDQMHVADLSYTRGTILGEMVGPLVFVPVLLAACLYTGYPPPVADDRRTPGVAMMKALGAGGVNVSSTWDVIKAFPVFNPHTDYSVVMVPATGYYSGIVWMG